MDCSGTQFTIFNNGNIRPRGIEDCTQGFAQQCNPNRPNAMMLQLDKTDATCPNAANGSITSTIIGGLSPFIYNWSNGENSDSISNLSAGLYALEVIDSAECSQLLSIEVEDPRAMEINFTTTSSCETITDGVAMVSVINGISPYSFEWDDAAMNQNTETAINLSAGNYNITITDSNNCEISDEVEITNLPTNPILVSCLKSTNNSVEIMWDDDPTADSYEVNVDNLGWVLPSSSLTHFVSGLEEEQVVTIQVRGIRTCLPLPIGSTSCIAFEFDKTTAFMWQTSSLLMEII